MIGLLFYIRNTFILDLSEDIPSHRLRNQVSCELNVRMEPFILHSGVDILKTTII